MTDCHAVQQRLNRYHRDGLLVEVEFIGHRKAVPHWVADAIRGRRDE